MNATLHSITETLACSIAITPKYPVEIQTQQQANEYLQESLQHLIDLGWEVDIKIGASRDYEDDTDPDLFKHMKPGEIFDTLFNNDNIKESLTDYWRENNGQEWTDTEIVSNLTTHLGIILTPNSDNFNHIRNFYNQQMMFELVGYKNEADFNKCKGETLHISLYSFLRELQADICKWKEPFDEQKIIKVRSNDGEYSAKTYNLPDIMGLKL
jgi:hypothetical protein